MVYGLDPILEEQSILHKYYTCIQYISHPCLALVMPTETVLVQTPTPATSTGP